MDKQREFVVTWKIELSADTPQEAAKLAREIQLDDSSLANYFTVQELGEDGFSVVEVEV